MALVMSRDQVGAPRIFLRAGQERNTDSNPF
jgi:hypothetical protein